MITLTYKLYGTRYTLYVLLSATDEIPLLSRYITEKCLLWPRANRVAYSECGIAYTYVNPAQSDNIFSDIYHRKMEDYSPGFQNNYC